MAQIEPQLYFPLCQKLKEIFDTMYVEDSYTIERKTGYMRAPAYGIKNPCLEITANGKVSDFKANFPIICLKNFKLKNYILT